jgi:hypothetical protein
VGTSDMTWHRCSRPTGRPVGEAGRLPPGVGTLRRLVVPGTRNGKAKTKSWWLGYRLYYMKKTTYAGKVLGWAKCGGNLLCCSWCLLSSPMCAIFIFIKMLYPYPCMYPCIGVFWKIAYPHIRYVLYLIPIPYPCCLGHMQFFIFTYSRKS